MAASLPNLAQLIELFYPQSAELGEFTAVQPTELPPYANQLLNHHSHMTVAMETFHHSAVDVVVLDVASQGNKYSRKILLRRKSDGAVVQFGLVTIDFSFVSAEVRRDIESRQIPLGRVLIDHDVLRQVELSQLWRIEPGPDLQVHLELENRRPVYGRTALIWCDGQPAVELLEIAAPVEQGEASVPGG